MTVTVTPTQETIYTVLRSFILSLIATEVIQGLGNGVSTPIGGFIAMTASGQNRLSTNISGYNDPDPSSGTKKTSASMSYKVQLDCYGPESSNWATTLAMMLRDEYACSNMGPDVQPLYADDPVQIPLVNAEADYEQRWMVSAVLQFNPVVSVSQEFAGSVAVDLINVDATYKP